jgi:hypothetical protein
LVGNFSLFLTGEPGGIRKSPSYPFLITDNGFGGKNLRTVLNVLYNAK